MLALIKEEMQNIGKNKAKMDALFKLKNLVDDRVMTIHTPIVYKINNLLDLLNSFHQENLSGDIFKSWFKNMGGMQKVFAVANHYFRKYTDHYEKIDDNNMTVQARQSLLR